MRAVAPHAGSTAPRPDMRARSARPRGMLVVVAGHSRGVGKTTTIERILRARRGESWVAVKVSAHRHCAPGDVKPVIEPDTAPSAGTQTGRFLLAGADRAFLCRTPDARLAATARFINDLRAGGANVIVESNRLIDLLTPDVVIFAVTPGIADWKPSSGAALARTDAFVIRTDDDDDPLQVVRALGPHGRTRFAIDAPGQAVQFHQWLDRRLTLARSPAAFASALLHLPVLVLLLVLASGAAHAQTPAPAAAPIAKPAAKSLRLNVANLTRLESWSFFDPPLTGGDPDSLFISNRLRVTATFTSPRVDVTGVVQYVQFGGLPTQAFGPGFLGTGGLYYFHAGETDSRGFYSPAANVRLKLPRGVTLLGGRFGYTSGAESPSGQPKVEALKRSRLDSRVVGDFEWSIYQRAFDGVRIDVDRPRWHVSGAYLWPTQGGFEEDAGATMADVTTGAVTATLRPGLAIPRTDVALFVYTYADDRRVTARPDNTGRSATQADITVGTFGASVAGSRRTGNVDLDWLGWYAQQAGSWYEQDHRAWSLALETGVQWTTGWQPWIRGGYLYASGDDDPLDAEHHTYFPALPTVRRYSFTTVYAPMNLRDLFVELIVRPSPRVRGRVDVRQLWLAQGADRWYAGSGATQRTGTFFGYAGRASGAHEDFGTVVEGAMDVTIGRRWSINGFAGFINGGKVVTNLFRGKSLWFGYLENVIQF